MADDFANGFRKGDEHVRAQGNGRVQNRGSTWRGGFEREGWAARNADRGYMMSKVELCRMFYKTGYCTYGDNCRFSHENPEKVRQISNVRNSFRRHRGVLGSETGRFGERDSETGRLDCRTSARSHPYRENHSLMRKTKLCHFWVRTGDCPIGKQCNFAHGQAELRRLDRCSASKSIIELTTTTSKTSLAKELTTSTSKTSLAKELTTTTSKTPPAKEAASNGETEAKNTPMQPACVTRSRIKQRKLGSINGIYADWIDD